MSLSLLLCTSHVCRSWSLKTTAIHTAVLTNLQPPKYTADAGLYDVKIGSFLDLGADAAAALQARLSVCVSE